MTSLVSSLLLVGSLHGENMLVKISDRLSQVVTKDLGQKITVSRVQDVNNKLIDDFAKTSRACPPYCLQPTKIDKNIQNIGELELLNFLGKEVLSDKAVLIDTRLHSWFELETIPSAINIPFSTIESASDAKLKKIFKILGMRVKGDGTWDFANVKKLIIFDNGIWCSQANHFLPNLLAHHYPADKIFYYRSGLQGWKLLGLTTVVHKEIVTK